jgi:hypothetical protein
MFFLLRAAFWLTIVLALLPTGSSNTSARGPQVGEAVSAAGATVSDVRHFCVRQPEACEVGSQVAVMVGQRAKAGAKLVYDLFNEHSGPSETGSLSGAKPEPAATPAPGIAKGVLTPSDRAPTWHSSERR